jgi:hypothetical protein
MRALRALACVLVLFACLHTSLYAVTDLLIGVFGHVLVTALEPKKEQATEKQKLGVEKARESFTFHAARGAGRGLIACVELIAAFVVFTKRRSRFLFAAGALAIGSAVMRAWTIPRERIEHFAKDLPPADWYKVQPNGTWIDFLPSAIHALGGALVILVAVLVWRQPSAVPVNAEL